MWPKAITKWQVGRVGYLSIPFTWLLPKAVSIVTQRSLFIDRWVVGGPAVYLMPEMFDRIDDVEIRYEMPGVLQRINGLATRTTLGCPNRCKFCAIGQGIVEKGGFRELDDWPNLPILCDNNLLASTRQHFDKVCDRLHEKWHDYPIDFNQGLDVRLMDEYHIERFAEFPKALIRVAFDSDGLKDIWTAKIEQLREAGIAKNRIRVYVLIGFNDTPETAYRRVNLVHSMGLKPNPQWFHRLDALKHNQITDKQREMGWNKQERINLMSYFYIGHGWDKSKIYYENGVIYDLVHKDDKKGRVKNDNLSTKGLGLLA